MNENDIRAKFAPRKCENQVEFDQMMQEMNSMQTELNHPYADKERELLKQIDVLMAQKHAIFVQIETIQIQRRENEQYRKDINRVFHDLKHQLIMFNPREGFIKKDEEDERID